MENLEFSKNFLYLKKSGNSHEIMLGLVFEKILSLIILLLYCEQ